MQILHPFTGPMQPYLEQLADPDLHRPAYCPQCQAKHPLIAHGFYTRTRVDSAFDGVITIRLSNTCLMNSMPRKPSSQVHPSRSSINSGQTDFTRIGRSDLCLESKRSANPMVFKRAEGCLT